MSRIRNQILIGVGLVGVSALMYLGLWAVFGQGQTILFYLIHDVAFLPIEFLLVTVIISQLLASRERAAMLSKLNMVIGAFYSEVGTELLRRMSGFDPDLDGMRELLICRNDWSGERYAEAIEAVSRQEHAVRIRRGDLAGLKEFLIGKRGFMLGLLQNPNLLEHAEFSELLWAVFHLTEELASRDDLTTLPPADEAHLEGDIRRAYGLAIREWLRYMRHLSRDYPYLFSLAVRLNPFDPQARVEVQA
jgi:hypothetical protein